MKILQINILGSTLSTGRTTREMHEYFQEHGIESYIVCPTNKDCNDAFTFTTTRRVKMDYILTMLTGREACYSKGPTRKLISYINKVQPDVVHLRVLHGNCIHLGMLLKYLAKEDIATVITMHDFWFMTGMCFHYTKRGCYRWERGCGKCPAIKTDVRQKKFDRTHMLWKNKKTHFQKIPRLAVVCVSDWVKEEVKRSFLNKATIVQKIYNWIDLEVFCPQDTAVLRETLHLNEKFVILGVSAEWSIANGKGLETYLGLAKQMPERYHIILVGEMNYEGELPINVTSVGRINSKTELAKYYSMADVYLNLSLEETFGKVAAEAISCGTPLIACDATANKELVPCGGGKVIESIENIKILEALGEVEARGKEYYIETCRNFAEKNFDKNKNIEQYISIYRELMKA